MGTASDEERGGGEEGGLLRCRVVCGAVACSEREVGPSDARMPPENSRNT